MYTVFWNAAFLQVVVQEQHQTRLEYNKSFRCTIGHKFQQSI